MNHAVAESSWCVGIHLSWQQIKTGLENNIWWNVTTDLCCLIDNTFSFFFYLYWCRTKNRHCHLPMMNLAFCTAALVISTLGPRLQKPCWSGGLTWNMVRHRRPSPNYTTTELGYWSKSILSNPNYFKSFTILSIKVQLQNPKCSLDGDIEKPHLH